MKRWIQVIGQFAAGAALVAVSAYGVCYGVQAGIAHSMYHDAKYGDARGDYGQVLNRCEEAHALYPYNYYFSIWTAEKAFYTSFDVDKNEAEKRIAAAERWCDIGLAQNFHNSQLQLLKTRLIERKSLPEAIKFWEAYVEFQFWEPYNHAVLAEMYTKAGDFEKAFDSLEWTKGSKYHDETAKTIKDAWNRDMTSTLPSPRPRTRPRR
jgi:tetratricopeptide (TPR) repeat protein